MPVTQFEQPTRRVGSGGSRGRVGLAAWALVLGAIAVVGALGRDPPDDERRADAALSAASPGPSGGHLEPAGNVLVLTEPAARVTGIAVPVRGHATEVVDQIELVLMRGDTTLARQTVRPSRRGRFGSVFTLAPPRAAEALTVVATGMDDAGNLAGVATQAVILGALKAVPAPDPRTGLGNDGLMGGLTAWYPEPSQTPLREAAPGTKRSWPVGRLAWQANPAQR